MAAILVRLDDYHNHPVCLAFPAIDSCSRLAYFGLRSTPLDFAAMAGHIAYLLRQENMRMAVLACAGYWLERPQKTCFGIWQIQVRPAPHP